ncbi:MAG TPA: hypothetical protein VGO57_16980 [Verrucomicrobiae bacterium]|jgi:hypothetical protein
MSIKRVSLIGLFAIILIFALIGLCFITDPVDGPPTFASKISSAALLVAAWPCFALTAVLPGGFFSDRIAYLITFLMLIPTGLFWGILIDFIRTKIARHIF